MELSMKEKVRRNDLQSDSRELPSRVDVSKESRVMSFEMYFRKMQVTNPRIHAHHREPMKSFAAQKGVDNATEAEFDEIFKDY